LPKSPKDEKKEPKEPKEPFSIKLPKCCEIPTYSPTPRLNWCFIGLITIACALSGM